MLDKTLSKNKPKNYKFVIITLDSHSAGPVARVQAKLKPYFPTLEITVHAAAEWAENPKSLEIAKNDILNADIIIIPIYQFILIIVASIFGEFQYFWKFEKKFLKRIKIIK